MLGPVSDDAHYRAEIARRCRRRMAGVYVCIAAAALFGTGVAFSTRMIHGDGYSAATGTIVALGTGSSGEPTFTGEFTDAAGVVHRDTQEYGYHYARGEPQLGQRVKYLYKASALTGDFHSFPSAAGIVHWVFGIPAVLFVLLGALFAWLIARERGFRLRLLGEGRRERLHVTLAFLGDFPEASDAPARAMAAAGRTRGESFALVIDQAASFGPTWFLGSSCPPVELAALHASLTAELAGEGFALERRAFHPHLTFLRKAGSALPATPITPIAWHAEDFLLFDSRSTEQRYVELGRWKLGTQ
jgi:2'-5' RNA ligase